MDSIYKLEDLANVKPEDIQGIQYLMTVNPGASEQLIRERVLQVALNMGAHPNWLMCVILAESGGKPTAYNKHGGASGLIQFMPSTAKSLGTTTEAIRKMSVYEQLEYVDKFYQQWFRKRKVKYYWDVYMATFLPKFIGQPMDYVLAKKGHPWYDCNSVIDTQKKGYLTVGDLAARTASYGKKYGITI